LRSSIGIIYSTITLRYANRDYRGARATLEPKTEVAAPASHSDRYRAFISFCEVGLKTHLNVGP